MAYFLMKTEPDVYSFDDFVRDKETVWDGVTNPTAVKNLREMKPGTKWIFYHTGDERTAVGTGTVESVDASNPKVPVVKVKAGKRLKTPKTLAEIKAEKIFAQSPAGAHRASLGGSADRGTVGLACGLSSLPAECSGLTGRTSLARNLTRQTGADDDRRGDSPSASTRALT